MSQTALRALNTALLSLSLEETSAHEFLAPLAKRPRLRDVEIREDTLEIDERGRVLVLAEAQATINGDAIPVPLMIEGMFDGRAIEIEDLAIDEEEFLLNA